jgi:hypothetical protein
MPEVIDFIIQAASVVCPLCEFTFATPNLAYMPNPNRLTPVEADLHRVLPDPGVRGALVTVCPSCTYAGWLALFQTVYIIPALLVPTPLLAYSKKFGFALLSARKLNEPLLDRAILAMNGLWCAREELAAGIGNQKDVTRWYKVATIELSQAMEDKSWSGNTSRYSYILGELLRQMGDFHGAVRYLETVDRRSMLPKEVVDHQIRMAKEGNSSPILLPPYLVEKVFILPKPAAPNNLPQTGVTEITAAQQQVARLA